MRSTIANIWTSIKRNPVINAFLIAVATQVFQDWRTGDIDLAHIWGYLAAVMIAVATRQFTTPSKEVDKIEREAYMRGIATPRATPGVEWEEGK